MGLPINGPVLDGKVAKSSSAERTVQVVRILVNTSVSRQMRLRCLAV